jgi:hypothetical protein
VVSKCLSSATAFYKQAGIRGLQAPMAMARLPLLSWLSALTLKIGRFFLPFFFFFLFLTGEPLCCELILAKARTLLILHSVAPL